MKTKIKLENETIEVQLPHFRKSSAHVYKVISDKNCIQVFLPFSNVIGMVMGGIELQPASLAWNSNTSEECTEQYFVKCFKNTVTAMEYIGNETITPFTTEQWEKAQEEDYRREMGENN